MSPFFAPLARFDPTNQAHLDYYAVSYEGLTLSLEYVGGSLCLRGPFGGEEAGV